MKRNIMPLDSRRPMRARTLFPFGMLLLTVLVSNLSLQAQTVCFSFDPNCLPAGCTKQSVIDGVKGVYSTLLPDATFKEKEAGDACDFEIGFEDKTDPNKPNSNVGYTEKGKRISHVYCKKYRAIDESVLGRPETDAEQCKSMTDTAAHELGHLFCAVHDRLPVTDLLYGDGGKADVEQAIAGPRSFSDDTNKMRLGMALANFKAGTKWDDLNGPHKALEPNAAFVVGGNPRFKDSLVDTRVTILTNPGGFIFGKINGDGQFYGMIDPPATSDEFDFDDQVWLQLAIQDATDPTIVSVLDEVISRDNPRPGVGYGSLTLGFQNRAVVVKLDAVGSQRQDGFKVNFPTCLYVNNDNLGPNSVAAFQWNLDTGGLSSAPGSPFLTGGTGGGGGLFAHQQVAVTGDFVYVSNALSDNVSGFQINAANCTLTLLPGSPWSTGGTSGFGLGMGLTVSPDGRSLYANHGQSSNIRTFGIGGNGSLTTVGPLVSTGSTPDAMEVSPDDGHLYIADFSTDRYEHGAFEVFNRDPATGQLLRFLDLFQVRPMGLPPGIAAGLDVNRNTGNAVYIGEVAFGDTQLDLELFDPNGMPAPYSGNPIMGPGANSNVVLVNKRGTLLFESNQDSKTITVFDLDPMTHIPTLHGAPVSTGDGRFPSGMVIDPTDALLGVVIYDPPSVDIFSGADTGDLVLTGTVTLDPMGGPLSVAVYPSAR